MQALPRTLPPLPLPMDRAFLAGASPCSKLSAAARRKRDFRDAGFQGGCATRAARRAQEAATDSSEVSVPRCRRRTHLSRVVAKQPCKRCRHPRVAASRTSSTSCCTALPRAWSAARPRAVPARGLALSSAPPARCARAACSCRARGFVLQLQGWFPPCFLTVLSAGHGRSTAKESSHKPASACRKQARASRILLCRPLRALACLSFQPQRGS